MEDVYWAGLVCVGWVWFCAVRMANKREALERDLWKCSPGLIELAQVRSITHATMLVFFMNPRKLYGPIVQSFWHDYPNPYAHDTRWWMVYNKIYLKLSEKDQREIRIRLSRKSAYSVYHPVLEDAISVYTGIDVDRAIGWIGHSNEAPTDMSSFAEEYDQIMAAQESMH